MLRPKDRPIKVARAPDRRTVKGHSQDRVARKGRLSGRPHHPGPRTPTEIVLRLRAVRAPRQRVPIRVTVRPLPGLRAEVRRTAGVIRAGREATVRAEDTGRPVLTKDHQAVGRQVRRPRAKRDRVVRVWPGRVLRLRARARLRPRGRDRAGSPRDRVIAAP